MSVNDGGRIAMRAALPHGFATPGFAAALLAVAAVSFLPGPGGRVSWHRPAYRCPWMRAAPQAKQSKAEFLYQFHESPVCSCRSPAQGLARRLGAGVLGRSLGTW